MTHGPTRPDPRGQRSPRPADEAIATGPLRGAVDGQRGRVRPPTVATPGRPDTPSPRQRPVVWGRLLGNECGRPWCTRQALAPLVGRTTRQAARPHLEEVRQGGADVRAFVRRQRTVAAPVVDAGGQALLPTPWAGPAAWAPRVQAPWGRHARRVVNRADALEPLSWVAVLRTRRRPWEAGHGHDQDASLGTERLANLALPPTPPPGLRGPSGERGRRRADPTAWAARLTPALPLAPVPHARGGLTCRLTLGDWNGPLSGVGRWGGVHHTPVRRWVVGRALAVWPGVAQGSVARVHAPLVEGAEPWRTSRGRWPEGCGVLAVATARPLLAP
jgi:hypothetical protein